MLSRESADLARAADAGSIRFADATSRIPCASRSAAAGERGSQRLPGAGRPGGRGRPCGTARFTAGRDAGNCLDPGGPVETRLVTIDSLIGERRVTGMKIDVEGFELGVLRGCARALAEQRIGLIQLEWNALSERALGIDRRPVAGLLAGYGYRLYRPEPAGRLGPVSDLGFGPDVFARPAGSAAGSCTTEA